jgi:hypothetical protein
VLALSLIRQKFAKNPSGSIPCKFSIDAPPERLRACVGRIHHFETIAGFLSETRRSPFASNAARKARETPREHAVLSRRPARLSVHLMSL